MPCIWPRHTQSSQLSGVAGFLTSGRSISRIGEGLLEVMIGGSTEAQERDPDLAGRLSEILKAGSGDACVVATWPFIGFYGKGAADWCFSYAQQNLDRILPHFNPNGLYALSINGHGRTYSAFLVGSSKRPRVFHEQGSSSCRPWR